MAYEIDKVFIGSNIASQELEILNAKAKEGWEPYAIVGSFHYFKRTVPEIKSELDLGERGTMGYEMETTKKPKKK